MEEDNEFLSLPDDAEEAFAVLQRKKFIELQDALVSGKGDSGWELERTYVDFLLAFDEVHDLGFFREFRNPPVSDQEFSSFYHRFRRAAEMARQKILIEAARRVKSRSTSIVILDAASRTAIHALIQKIREKLGEMELPDNKREALFNKLNAFAAEVDRDRTRAESFNAFVVDLAKTARTAHKEIKPLEQTIDRVIDLLDKAKKLRDSLPSWRDPAKIEAPHKQLPRPNDSNGEIPF